MMVLDENSGDVYSYNWMYKIEFHGDPSSCCGEISFKTTNVNLIVTLKEKSEDQQT